MKKSKKILIVCTIFIFLFTLPIFAATTEIKIKEYGLTAEIDNNFTILNKENAKQNTDLIESFGYNLSSFKDYLTKNNIILFAVCDNIQINIKAWETEFSSNILDLSSVSDSSFDSIAKQLIGKNFTSYKTVKINNIKYIEILNNSSKSENFCTVQYLTIRNGKFFSITTSYLGKLDEQKIQNAWDFACTVNIKNLSNDSSFSVSNILYMIFSWLFIIAGAVGVILIVTSFVKDYIKKRNNTDYGTEWIERKK